jgi:hypothetical protein
VVRVLLGFFGGADEHELAISTRETSLDKEEILLGEHLHDAKVLHSATH